MALQSTGKQRASRIPLDYFKRSSRLDRGKLLLAIVAAALTLAGGALLIVSNDRQEAWISPGPVASVHAIWENDCMACHVPFSPIRDDAVAMFSKAGVHSADDKCRACHSGAEHHATQVGGNVSSCAGCHQEHRGRDASLTRIANQNCTVCHAEIDQHIATGVRQVSPALANVTDFELNHPDFRSIKSDPGTIKFSHKQHMTAGMASSPGDRAALKLGMLSIGDQVRYFSAKQTDSDLVQLRCDSCHQLGTHDERPPTSDGILKLILRKMNDTNGKSGESSTQVVFPPPVDSLPDAMNPDRTDGRRMQPITYENQCRACHPLTLDPAASGENAVLLPHRLSPGQMYTTLRNYFAGQLLAANPKLLERSIPLRPTPGRSPDSEEVEARRLINEKVAGAAAHVARVCSKCHEQTLVSCGPDKDSPIRLPQIQPAKLPQAWYEHAEFSHAAHRAVNCLECHARADGKKASKSNHDVLIPDRDVCLRCHSRPRQGAAGPEGGARFDCTECHRYHNGDAPLAGRGAEALGPETKQTIQNFLEHTGNPPTSATSASGDR